MSRPPDIAARFPAFMDSPATAIWVIPMTSANTVLQYGKFRDLDPETLRPTRDSVGPVLSYTADGKVRGQVRIRDGMRHIDVHARNRVGTRVTVHVAQHRRWGNHAPAVPVSVNVTGVRALRLRAFYIEEAGAPWSNWDGAMQQDRGALAEIADHAWDEIIAALSPSPKRYAAEKNPWVWCHRLVETR